MSGSRPEDCLDPKRMRDAFTLCDPVLVEEKSITIRGSCLCGGVTFEIDRACGPAEFCHCNRCRKRSGSMSLLMIRVNTKDYRLLTGAELVKPYAAPILYSPPAYHSFFCSNCGSPVPEPAPDEES